MPTFGANEGGERIFLSGVGGIYALAQDPKKVVKVLQPPPAVWSDDRLQEEIDAFRVRAKIQRIIANSSKHWAPIYEISALRQGTEALSGGGDIIQHPSSIGDPYAQRPVASGAFLVMDRYERSFQSLIDGRVNLLNADLRCLITAVMKALLDFSKQGGPVGGRPHGALKASNILLKNSADLTMATVHLTDPAPDGALDKNSGHNDLGNIARMIYELVNHRPYEEGTIGRSRDWDALGPNGEDWRELCIALLDPQAPPEERNLEKLIPKIDIWRRKPKKSKKPMMIGVAASLLIAGSIFTYQLMHPKVVYDAGRWEALNLEYHAWFGDFVKPLYDPKKLPELKRTDFPPEVDDIFDKYKDFVRYDPEQIDNSAANWEARINVPNGDNPLARYGDNPKYTQQGLMMMEEVANALTPDKWPALKALNDAADRYEKRESPWSRPAAGIRKIIAGTQPPRILNEKMPLEDAVKEYTKTPLHERIKKSDELRQERQTSVFQAVVAAAAEVKEVRAVDAHWNRIDGKVKAIPGTQSPEAGGTGAGPIPLLAGLPKFVDAYPAAQATEDVASLEVPFNQLDEMLDTLAAAFPQGRTVDFAELMTDDATKLPPSVDNYKALAKATENYWNITKDPRDGGAWAKQLSTINDMITAIKESAAANDQELPKINQEFSRIGDTIKSTTGLKPILKNEKAITDNAAAIARDLLALESRSNEHPAYMNQAKFDAYIVLQRSRAGDPRQFPASLANAAAPVKAKWLEAQNGLINVVSKRTLAEFRKTHVADERKFVELETFFADFDKSIPEDDARRVELEKAFAAGPDWAVALAKRVAAESRVKGLADLLASAVKDAVNPPAITDATYVSLRQQSLRSYQQICLDTQTLISDHLTMDARLNSLRLDKTEGWRKLWETWPDGKNALLAETPVKAIRTRVGTLLAAESQTDYAKIRDASLSDTPEIALASWRLLGAAPIAEATPYLADEQAAEKKLAAHLEKIKTADAAQAQTLAAEITKAQPARWQRWSDLAATADNIALAIAQAKTFNVEINKQTQPVMFYYEQVLKLRDDAKAHPREAELKPIAQTFSDLLTKDPALAPLSKDPNIATLLELMRKSMSEDQNMSATGQGPQLAGWDMEQPNQDIRIFRSKDKKFTLEFRRMQVDENSLTDKPQKTIFLCTTEMSVGLFIQVMNANNKLEELTNSKFATSQQAHWFDVPATNYYTQGPRSWMITGDQFALSSKWLDEAGDPITNGKPFYPTGAAPTDPFVESPVQLITPWVAMYVSRLLGCRLPTSDEWQAAYATFEAPKPGSPALPRDIWNLRGENAAGKPSWATQQAYADGYPERVMPYPDAGMYAWQSVTGKTAPPKATNAKPWMAADLAKIAPDRITAGAGVYSRSTLWFEPVDKINLPAGATAPVMHHLVGNVAEFVFDSDEIIGAVQNNAATPAIIDQSVTRALNKIFVIGGSSISPPEIPFNEKQPVVANSVPTRRGYCDVGFRLAYTAPKETIVEVLAKAFRDPKSLPGPRKPRTEGTQ